MKSEFKPLFAVPLGIYKFDQDEEMPKLFSKLTEDILNSPIENYTNLAKRNDVTTDHSALQIKIKTSPNAPEHQWDNEWWKNGNASTLLSGLLEVLDIFKDETFSNLGLSKDPPVRTFVKDFWMVRLQKNHYNGIHVHPGSTFSGIYYQSVPDSIKKSKTSEGTLMLMDTTHKQMFDSSYGAAQSYSIKPHERMLVMFPSWLSHYVTPFKSGGDRISFAFNIIDDQNY